VPSFCDLLIMSAVSIHRKPYLRLRNLIEIQALGLGLKERDWEQLASKAQAYQCSQLVYSALLATKAVLESEIPESPLKAMGPSALKRRAFALCNRRVSPSAIGRSLIPGGRSSTPRPNPWDRARRFLPLSTRQLMRFVWFRIVLYRLFRVLKW
jgi:hypothetical protein